MAGCLSVLPGLLLSSITETRYCISDHLLWFGAPLTGGRSPCYEHLSPGRSSSASPISRASVGCILRASGRPVDLHRYALREGSRFDQDKRYVRAVVGAQPRALADDHRDDEQIHLVDDVVLKQPPGQGTAPVHLQLTHRLA